MSPQPETDALPARRAMLPSAPAAFKYYSVFGRILQSEIALPELESIESRTAHWTLRVARSAPSAGRTTILGERLLGRERYQLAQTPSGFRLDYSHAGSFDVSADGRQIVWHPNAQPSMELVRAIILGPVVAIALEAAGCLCLHGSAVSVEGGAVAFIAPKHFGKSTLAMALTIAGARFIADDTLAVTRGPTPQLLPGVSSARLWQDALAALGVDRVCERVMGGIKTTVTGFAAPALAAAAAPLSAVYVIEPEPSTATEEACRRVALSASETTVVLAHHTKLPDPLIGLRAAGARLRRAAEVAAAIPGFRLHIRRDLACLPHAVAQILEWHRSRPVVMSQESSGC